MSSNETEFVNGLIVKAPNDNAPEYVKAKISIRRAELIAWLQTKPDEWINADVKVSQGGKWYVAVDTWKPNGGTSGSRGGAAQRERPAKVTDMPADEFADDSIPFIAARSVF
jgi:hypothetical protein